MSTDFSELIAMGCPDLKPNSDGNKIVEIMDGGRRLSIKQMTATELAATRVVAEAARIETETALAKAIAHANAEVTINNTQPSESSINNGNVINDVTLNTSSRNCITTRDKRSPVKTLPTMPPARSRITSLPNIMHINEVEYEYADEDEFVLAEKPQLELQTNKGQMTTVNEAEETTAAAGVAIKRATSKSSEVDENSTIETTTDGAEFVTANSSIANSIERLRQQRLVGGTRNERARRSNSPSIRPLEPRAMAPDRLHSSSSSSTNSVSVSLSLNTSKNVSRRESDVSYVDEAQVSSSATVALSSPPVFPLSKTNSAPNFERRNSALSSIFPGPSPLVTGNTALHTEPKIEEEDGLTMAEIKEIVQETLDREIPTTKAVHRTKTPPPVGVKLGVNLKRVSPPRSHITVKKNDAPMLGVVLRKVEKKAVQQKSILDDDKPLYQLSIVRSDHKEYIPSANRPKPPAPLQKSASSTGVQKTNPGGILTGPQLSKQAQILAAQQKQAYNQRQQQLAKAQQRPQMGVPITIQKIEGDKIIIIKKFIIPKNGKIPEQYLKVRMFANCAVLVWNARQTSMFLCL